MTFWIVMAWAWMLLAVVEVCLGFTSIGADPSITMGCVIMSTLSNIRARMG